MSSLAPKLVEAESPKSLVTCRVCGLQKEARSMGGHVGAKHKLKVADYIEKYGETSSRDFKIFRGNVSPYDSPVAEDEADTDAGRAETTLGERTIEDELLEKFSPSEKRFYNDYSQEIFQQIDRDNAQWPVVMSLTIDMIQLTRLRLSQISDKLTDAKITQAIAIAVKTNEERIRAQMTALGISREAKLKSKAQIKSTPFGLISGYFDELERMSPQQGASLEGEERKQLAVMNERIDRLYLSRAVELAEQEEEDESLSNLDVERIIADADIEI